MVHPFDGLLSERVLQFLTMLCSRSHHAALRKISGDSLHLLNGIVCLCRHQYVVTPQVITAIGLLWQKLRMNTQRKQTAEYRYVRMHTYPSALPVVFCFSLISCVCCSILPSGPTHPSVWGQKNPRSRYGCRLNSHISNDFCVPQNLLVALTLSCGSVCFAVRPAQTLFLWRCLGMWSCSKRFWHCSGKLEGRVSEHL